jgi:hypothetical protein
MAAGATVVYPTNPEMAVGILEPRLTMSFHGQALVLPALAPIGLLPNAPGYAGAHPSFAASETAGVLPFWKTQPRRNVVACAPSE